MYFWVVCTFCAFFSCAKFVILCKFYRQITQFFERLILFCTPTLLYVSCSELLIAQWGTFSVQRTAHIQIITRSQQSMGKVFEDHGVSSRRQGDSRLFGKLFPAQGDMRRRSNRIGKLCLTDDSAIQIASKCFSAYHAIKEREHLNPSARLGKGSRFAAARISE